MYIIPGSQASSVTAFGGIIPNTPNQQSGGLASIFEKQKERIRIAKIKITSFITMHKIAAINKIIDVIILFFSSLVIKFSQNFFLYCKIYLQFY